MTTNYNLPWSARGANLGGLANALLDNPRPRSTFLGDLARNAMLEPPKPVTLADALLVARMLNPPANQADLYLRGILRREAVDTSPTSTLRLVQTTLWPVISPWANGHLLSVVPSGSFSKGTANASGTDIDLFISVSSTAVEGLREIYNTLDRALQTAGYKTRRQNVSININVAGQSVDLVPAKRQNWLVEDHSLYRRKVDSWTKTNVAAHALHVAHSGRTEEIRIMKLWRDQLGLDWPSFYLELTVIRALGVFSTYGDLAANVSKVFEFLRDEFLRARIVDPANGNNIISDDLTVAEKERISVGARARATHYWKHIVV
ncbi:hypothetical protein [Phenylobacterium sp. J367]|uniref:hypothetical protein n=1 Tax=Phenylobacterium sp. J367 TaxID=2898435 RepID=UPI0021518DA6|nr:hypothetical protein [Phenylobacterium sp. J367]MCR5881211.1 hypothetical protein [Phenylobacterium sp. J367]